MKFYSWLIIIALVTLSGCVKHSDIGPQCVTCENNPWKNDSADAVFITNEGNFGAGNGSLSIYKVKDATIQNNVYQSVNNELLGDVPQSITVINDVGYILINSSNKIQLIEPHSINNIGVINDVHTPRYMLQVEDDKAYITSLFGDNVYILKLSTSQITGTIHLPNWTETMILFNGYAYITNVYNDAIQVVNVSNDEVEETISVGKQPIGIVKDKNDKIWVLCDGGINEELPELIQIDPTTNSIIKTFQFPSINSSPSKLSIDVLGERLYYIDKGIFALHISDSNLPENPLISLAESNFYGLGISPNNNIYVSDAVDYVQNGFVFKFDTQGTLMDSFKVSIIPGNFHFYGEE